MKKLTVLFKTLFNTWYGISVFKHKASKNRIEILKLMGMAAIIVVSFAPILAGYIYYMIANYDSLSQFGQPGVIITLGVVASCTLVLFFGFLFVISTFYFSNDTEHLVAMPLKPSQILGAKFGVILTTEYITVFPLVLPPIIIFGIKSGAGLLYWLYSIAGILIIPVIPLCLTSVIAVIIMRVTNIGRKKDIFKIAGGIIGVFLILGVELVIQRVAMNGDPERIQNILFSENGLINAAAVSFPPAKWISIALIKYNTLEGLFNFLLFLGASLLSIIVFGYIGEKLFLGGYLGSRETEAKRRGLNEGQLTGRITARGKAWAIFWREFKIMNRVPIFFMNCVFVVFLVPAIFVIMPLIGGNQESQELILLVNGSGSIYTASIVVIGIGIFTTVANMTAPTSISREGAEFLISKYIPASPREQVMGKFIHALLLDVVGNLLVVIAVWFIIKINPATLAVVLIISSLAAIPIIGVSFMIDLFRPYLNWDNPTKAVKQNMNGIVAMFFNALWNALVLFGVGKFVPSPIIGYSLLAVIYIVLGFITYKALMAYADKRYTEIEV